MLNVLADIGSRPRTAVVLTRRAFFQILLVAPGRRLVSGARSRFTSLAGVDLDLIWHRCSFDGPPRLCPG